MTKRKAGRHTKYSPTTVAAICGWIERGMSQKDAGTLAGISETTFHTWRQKYPDFATAIEESQAKFKAWHVMNIVRHADDNPAHSKWLLERKFPEEYGRTVQDQNLTVSGEIATVLVRRKSDE